MTQTFDIRAVRTEADLTATAALFQDYATSLPVDLAYQDFSAELAALPGKYAPPAGELLIARDRNGEPLGCVGLRPLSAPGGCEMKRLFLLPAARGLGLGRAMSETLIAEARRRGYRELRLDTLPTMSAAIRLSEQLGFGAIAPYYAPTPVGTIFMGLKLSPDFGR
jgi:GNAT superfamily N-acetyltransferase